jgi:small subunit ribosomal protein S6
MRLYETIFIVKPDIIGEGFEELYKNVKDFLEKTNCQVLKEENWGKRKLAYEIDKYKEGQYCYVKYVANNHDAPKELERLFNLNEGILRYISVKIEDNIIEKNDKQNDKQEDIIPTTEANISEEKEQNIEIQDEDSRIKD